jgi:hypothetical protein
MRKPSEAPDAASADGEPRPGARSATIEPSSLSGRTPKTRLARQVGRAAPLLPELVIGLIRRPTRRLLKRTALPARQCSGELAYCLLMLLVPDLSKAAGDLELHTPSERDLPRPFFPDTFVKIVDRRAQRAGDLK